MNISPSPIAAQEVAAKPFVDPWPSLAVPPAWIIHLGRMDNFLKKHFLTMVQMLMMIALMLLMTTTMTMAAMAIKLTMKVLATTTMTRTSRMKMKKKC